MSGSVWSRGAAGVIAAALCASVGAQQLVVLTGRLVNSVTGGPVMAAVVVIEELNREATSAVDGSFTFGQIPPGTYHLLVRTEGYTQRRSEVVVSPAAASPIEVRVDPDLRYHEVISVSPDARSAFEAYQPTSALVGQELDKRLEMSLGTTLENQPGVSSRSFGPASARPVIRGLDGDRVLILQDGQRTGDLSSQSADHAVAVNPAAARRIEVVRGPATLMYGSNAIGGLVNVIAEEIPTEPITRISANALADVGSAANEASTAVNLRLGNGTWAMSAGGGARHSDDVQTPEGEVVNSQSRSAFGGGGVSWTATRGYAGASYAYDDTRNGIPVVEDGSLEIKPRRHSVTVRGGAQGLNGAVDSFRTTLSMRRYKHEEVEGDIVGTAFRNDTNEFEALVSHRAVGRLEGSVGASYLDRNFDAVGDEALSPAVDQNTVALFLYEELTWPHVTIQFGGRVDHADYAPAGEPARDFTTGSGSTGVLFRPAAANDAVTVAFSLALASRYPSLEELFYFGPHPGNFAFEIGNPDLDPEEAFGLDLSLRWRTGRWSGEFTYFRNDITEYVFARPVSEEEFEAREDEFAARFPGRDISGEDHGDFPFVEYVGADSLLQGVEAHADFQMTLGLSAELGVDYVRGSLEETSDPLPRIPPFRVRTGLRYQRNALQIGGELVAAAAQERVAVNETTTDGYQVVRLFGGYSFQTGRGASTITLRADNVTNELYRNHLSYLKAFVPEMGRNIKVLYRLTF